MSAHHKSPIVAYHMQQRKWHQGMSNDAHQALGRIKKYAHDHGASDATNKASKKARSMRDDHQTLANLHNKLVHHYGHGASSAFGTFHPDTQEFHLSHVMED